MDHVRLRGTARRIGEGKGPLAGTCELTHRQKKQRHVVDGRFELVDGDGKKSTIVIAGTAVIADGERRATYAKLADEPGVAAIALRPDPSVEVTLKSAWILDDKPIEVVGTTGDGVIKAVAAGSPQAIDAWEKQKASEESRPTALAKPIPWNVIVPFALLVIAIALGEVAVTMSWANPLVAPTIVITVAGIAAGLLWNQVRLPKFDERERSKASVATMMTLAILVGIGVNLPPEGPVGTSIVGAVVLGVTIFGLVRERRIIGLMKRLARPTTVPAAGKPGVFVGSVGDKTPDQFFSQLIAIGSIHTVTGKGSDTTIDTERRGFDSTFHLSLDKADLEIDPKDAIWTSELRNKRETWSVFIPLKAEVVAAGTPQQTMGGLCLKSTAPDSLVFYAVTAGDDPQAIVRRKLLLHRLTYGAAFMVVALAAALAIHGFANPPDLVQESIGDTG